MDNQLGSRIVGGNTAYKRCEGDFYPTPREVTEALMRSPARRLFDGKSIWEPACGEGHMSHALELRGFKVFSSDIADICYGVGGVDFTTQSKRQGDFIITNPPFSLSEQFIRHSIQLGGSFALLLKSQYWHARKRLDLFREFKPLYIMPLTWRPDFLFGTRGGGSPLMDVVWCVWGSHPSDVTEYIPLPKPSED